ncbi:MAG TPA: DUF814 domain-containing protein [candidate division WOR-3 bacterium]|uniref:DUF814 domain-containing protein n=1 Tax=candidate division WOR-3 bacterium TaxID=2052148 RepID=A0A9C9K072_UNCW3|nr:DUF814 domain-containing protein [candidate division WOR-3 bacterium]
MNGIYVFLLLREIREELINAYIEGFWIKERMVQLVLGSRALFISLYPEAPALFLAEKRLRGFEKNPSFNNDLSSARITGVEQVHFTPFIRFKLERAELSEKVEIMLDISLYREAPNIRCRKRRSQRVLFSRYIEKSPKAALTDLSEEKLDLLYKKNRQTINSILVKRFEGIDKYLAAELSRENMDKLLMILRGEKAKPRLVGVSPLRISLFADRCLGEYSTLNSALKDGIKRFSEERMKHLLLSRKKILIKKLKRRIERLNSKLVDEREIEEHRLLGELILMNISIIKKGSDKVRLLNPYDDKYVEIKLDKDKSPQENAQSYFRKYKKLKRGQPKIRKKIESLKQEIKTLQAALPGAPQSLEVVHHGQKKEEKKFRVFNLASGSTVYVGKNARSNEELTFKYARPDDYFFHTRGYGGSHVLLKARVPKGQKPRKEDIESAAALAAYFSKAKKQTKVPVSYTQRKYLKRNKKGKPGSVILMREEVVFVKPMLYPEGGSDTVNP